DTSSKVANEASALDHFDLAALVYKSKVAASYALGRLLRRLEWHHEQAVVLAAQRICNATIPQPEWRRPIQAEDRKDAEKDYQHEWSDYRRDTKLLEKLRGAMEIEFCQQQRLGHRVANQIQVILLCPSAEI